MVQKKVQKTDFMLLTVTFEPETSIISITSFTFSPIFSFISARKLKLDHE